MLRLQKDPEDLPEEPVNTLTLGGIVRQVQLRDGKYLADGSLKTEAYLRHVASSGDAI